jgi:hypothetical protein
MFSREFTRTRKILRFDFVRRLLPLALIVLSACSNYPNLRLLQKILPATAAPPEGVQLNFCTDPSQFSTGTVKFIIILDHSGSNYKMWSPDANCYSASDGQNLAGLPCVDPNTRQITASLNYATDPTGQLRYGDAALPGTLLNYLHTLTPPDPNNPSRFYAFLDFNSSVSYSYPNIGATGYGAPYFLSDPVDFFNHIYADAHAGSTLVLPFPTPIVAPSSTSTPMPTPLPSGSPTPSVTLSPIIYATPSPTATVIGPLDGGSTSYLAPLEAAKSLIMTDISYAQQCAQNTFPPGTSKDVCPHPGFQNATKYVIIFMTDGSPIYRSNSNGNFDNGNLSPATYTQFNLPTQPPLYFYRENTSAILEKVTEIASMGVGNPYVSGINLYTIYYYVTGNRDEAGVSLLSQMARAGNGTFVDQAADPTAKINYQNFLPELNSIKYSLADVFVSNASVTWGADGQLHPSRNLDGMADDLVPPWTNAAQDPDPLRLGISNFVRYQLARGSCEVSKYPGKYCAPPVDTSVCSGLRLSNHTSRYPSPLGVYTVSDPDGFNDCEKLLLGGLVGNPDSNGDLIPDWLEAKNFTPFQLGSASAALNPFSEPYSTYQKIKFNLPTNNPVGVLASARHSGSDYRLKMTSDSDVQSCYELNVKDMPILGDKNTVQIDVILKGETIQNYQYRVGRKAYPSGSKVLKFMDWHDAEENAAGTWSNWP